MKRFLTLLIVIISITTAFSQSSNPKGGKGIIANFTNLDGHIGINDDKSKDLSVGLSAFYFIQDDVAVCPGISYNHSLNNEYIFTLGLREWIFDSYFIGVWFDNNFNDYSTAKIDIGYTYFLNQTVFIEPTLYYQESLNNLIISRFGFSLSIGINL